MNQDTSRLIKYPTIKESLKDDCIRRLQNNKLVLSTF